MNYVETKITDFPEVKQQIDAINAEYPFNLSHESNRIAAMVDRVIAAYDDFYHNVTFHHRSFKIYEQHMELKKDSYTDIKKLKESPAAFLLTDKIQEIEALQAENNEFNEWLEDCREMLLPPEQMAEFVNNYYASLCHKYNKIHGIKRTPECIKDLMTAVIKVAHDLALYVYNANKANYEEFNTTCKGVVNG